MRHASVQPDGWGNAQTDARRKGKVRSIASVKDVSIAKGAHCRFLGIGPLAEVAKKEADADADRQGRIGSDGGQHGSIFDGVPINATLAVAINRLFQNRPEWNPQAAVGRTVVSGRLGRHAALAAEFAGPVARRVEAPATAQQKKQLAALKPQQISVTTLAGEPIESILSHAPGNCQAIGGIKVNAASGWFAARPSGAEDIYRFCAERFVGPEHLQPILHEAQAIVDAAISPASSS